MNILFKLKLHFKKMFYFTVFCFFSWFLIFANYGLTDYLKLQKEINQFEKELVVLKKEKDDLLKQVRAFKDEDIDLDLLELQLKKVLCYARKDEKIYFWK